MLWEPFAYDCVLVDLVILDMQVSASTIPHAHAKGRAYSGSFVARLPEDGCTSLRGGHVVYRVLHDEVVVCAADGQRATTAALTNHHAQNGHAEAEHLPQVHCDGLTLQRNRHNILTQQQVVGRLPWHTIVMQANTPVGHTTTPTNHQHVEADLQNRQAYAGRITDTALPPELSMCSSKVPGGRKHLAELFSILAGIGARGIDKGDDGEPKMVGMAHEAQCLTVAIRLRHPKVAIDVLLHGTCHSIADTPCCSALIL